MLPQIEEIKIQLKQTLSKERYEHSIGVMKQAEKLAIHYQIDPDVAKLVGLIHDIAKRKNKKRISYLYRRAQGEGFRRR